MTHKQLVDLAGRWLHMSKQCNPVFCEKSFQGSCEVPDAIGWTTGECLIVECKTSKADFMANGNKSLRLGSKRYFLMTCDLYKQVIDLMPEGWGIVTVADENHLPRQERFKDSKVFESDASCEIRYLRSRILEVQRYGKY